MNIRSEIFGSSLRDESPLLRSKKPRGARADELHSVQIPREASRCADTRSADRQWLAGERAQVVHQGATYDVSLVNVCREGAMIGAAFDPLPWDKVKVQFGEGSPIKASVLWVKDGRIGLQFSDQAQLPEALIGTSSSAFAADGAPASTSRTGEEQRTEWRHVLTCDAMLHYDYDSTPARLRNVSADGAMIETRASLTVGAEPLIDFGAGGSIFGRVVWLSGDRAGLSFERKFDLAAIGKSMAPNRAN